MTCEGSSALTQQVVDMGGTSIRTAQSIVCTAAAGGSMEREMCCTRGKPEQSDSRCIATLTMFAVCLLQSVLCADELRLGIDAEQMLSRRGSLTLRDTNLPDALFTISETWNVNLLFSKDVSGHVNGVFRDVPLREVLDALLLANGYGYRPKGQSLIVMSLDALGDTNAMLQTASIPLPDGRSDDVVEAARLFLSPQGKMQVMSSVGSLMVIDYPENVSKVRNFVTSVYPGQENSGSAGPTEQMRVLSPIPINTQSASSKIAYFSPKHTDAASLRETFESFLGPQAKVVVIPEENRIAIIDRPQGIELAQQIFAELDRPRGQVRITALIYDVNISEIERLGMNWTHNARIGHANQAFDGKFGASPDPTAGAFTLGAVTDAAVDAATSSSTIGAGRLTTLSKYLDLSAVVSALDQVKGARLLADPSVTVIDREEASIRIVTEIPIQQLTQTSEGGSIGTTSFREAGITLTVTPQIGGDGTITMNVMPTFSVLSGFSEGQPIIDSREASTTVRIADGQTLVIGGLRQRSEVETVTGIPKLMKWKKFGKLFREHDTTIQETELIVFLRPEITTPDRLGTEREGAGLCVAHKALAKLHWPSEMPVVPSCGDPHCPYHCPRPRFFNPAELNRESTTHEQSQLTPVWNPLNEPFPVNGDSKDAEPQLMAPPIPEFHGNAGPEDLPSTDPSARWQRFLASDATPAKTTRKKTLVSQASLSRVVTDLSETDSGQTERAKASQTQWPEWLRPIRRALHRQQ